MFLSVVIPLLNEEESLPELYQRLRTTLDRLRCQREIIFVDDGSTDGSADVIRDLAIQDPTVVAIRLSRNFGHEAASTAGLDHASGDATVLMDADLQDPPEVIEHLVELWRQGHDIVYGIRKERHGESRLKKATSWLFYRVLGMLSDTHIPRDVGDFRLIDRKVLDAIKQCRERDRFVRGLVAWSGFSTAAVAFDRPARFAGVTKYNLWKMMRLAVDAAVGASVTPLRLATVAGLGIMCISAGMAAVVCLEMMLMNVSMSGFPLLAAGLFFVGGFQVLTVGILGEYIGRIYRQSQGRPLYLVTEKIGIKPCVDGAGNGAGEGHNGDGKPHDGERRITC